MYATLFIPVHCIPAYVAVVEYIYYVVCMVKIYRAINKRRYASSIEHSQPVRQNKQE